MRPFRLRFDLRLGVALCLTLAAGTPAAAQKGTHFKHAQTEALTFAALDGWKDDDQAAAFQAYMKSCGAILQGSKAMRKAQPVYGGLFNACEKAAKLAAGGTVGSRAGAQVLRG